MELVVIYYSSYCHQYFIGGQVRPPGHHAGVKQAMGFCLHNNAAVAALAAKRAGAKKVLIVDWVMVLDSFFGTKPILYSIMLINVDYLIISVVIFCCRMCTMEMAHKRYLKGIKQ